MEAASATAILKDINLSSFHPTPFASVKSHCSPASTRLHRFCPRIVDRAA
jgi:hypothetical protein